MENLSAIEVQKSKVDFVPLILLCYFLGVFGVHRFYAGRIGTGILMFVTLGGFGIWSMIDFIMIVTSNFKDSEGAYVKP